MSLHNFSVREITLPDVTLVAEYWSNADRNYMASLGVDVNKIPSYENLVELIAEQVQQKYEDKKAYALIWLIDNVPVGHCNINKIKFADEAYMHLHFWKSEIRNKGYGIHLLQLTIPYFFQNFQLQNLYCEPYALNPAPNKVLQNVGFEFVKEHITIPGVLNFEQPVKLWKMSFDNFTREK